MTEPSKKRRLSQGSEAADTPDPVTILLKADKSSENAGSRGPRRELFIRSLPASATTDSLAEHFSQSYAIKHAFVVNDTETKQSKGYGFVTFADVEDAQRALEEFNGSIFGGKKIRVDYAQPRHREIDEVLGKSVPSSRASKEKQGKSHQNATTQSPRLIVRNLPWSIKEPEDLAVHFQSFGKIKQVIVPKKGKKPAGFGFVLLRGRKNAERALESVNGKEVDGRTLAVDWAVEKSVWEGLQNESLDKDEGDSADKASDGEVAGGSDEASDVTSRDENTAIDEEMEDLRGSESEDDGEDAESEDDKEEDDGDEGDEEANEVDERHASTIFIRNLPFSCTDETLYEHFTQFGRLQYARVVVDRETERARGTGFVCFKDIKDAVSCIRDAPKHTDTIAVEGKKGSGASTGVKHSILQNESADPTGRYTLNGRVLQVACAVSRSQASKLEEMGISKRFDRDKDKRRLFLLSEGTISPNSPAYKNLSETERKMRHDSFKQRENFIKKNPTLHLSLTRLSVRNIPRFVSSKDLKALARQAVVGFATDVKNGIRQPLAKEELKRSSESMKEAELLRKQKRQGIVRQAKIVFEGRDGSKVREGSSVGRSRGYGFIEYFTHRHALMGLRWLNGHAVEPPSSLPGDMKDKKKQLIIEFAIENAQVVKRRNEQQSKMRELAKSGQQKAAQSQSRPAEQTTVTGKKRKRLGTDEKDKGEQRAEEDNKIAKRNRIIAKKRMQRKERKGKKA